MTANHLIEACNNELNTIKSLHTFSNFLDSLTPKELGWLESRKFVKKQGFKTEKYCDLHQILNKYYDLSCRDKLSLNTPINLKIRNQIIDLRKGYEAQFKKTNLINRLFNLILMHVHYWVRTLSNSPVNGTHSLLNKICHKIEKGPIKYQYFIENWFDRYISGTQTYGPVVRDFSGNSLLTELKATLISASQEPTLKNQLHALEVIKGILKMNVLKVENHKQICNVAISNFICGILVEWKRENRPHAEITRLVNLLSIAYLKVGFNATSQEIRTEKTQNWYCNKGFVVLYDKKGVIEKLKDWFTSDPKENTYEGWLKETTISAQKLYQEWENLGFKLDENDKVIEESILIDVEQKEVEKVEEVKHVDVKEVQTQNVRGQPLQVVIELVNMQAQVEKTADLVINETKTSIVDEESHPHEPVQEQQKVNDQEVNIDEEDKKSLETSEIKRDDEIGEIDEEGDEFFEPLELRLDDEIGEIDEDGDEFFDSIDDSDENKTS